MSFSAISEGKLTPVPQTKIKHDMLKSTERVAELQSIHRDLSVNEIASKFKGNSLVESRVEFQQKQSKITQKERLIQRAIVYFQNNKREQKKILTNSGDIVPNASYNSFSEEDMKLPEPLSKLQSFWTANPTTPKRGVSHRASDIPLQLTPNRNISPMFGRSTSPMVGGGRSISPMIGRSISPMTARSTSPMVERISTKDFEEVLEKNGISKNTLSAEDWEHWQKALASAVEDHRSGTVLEAFPSSISSDIHNDRGIDSLSEMDENYASSSNDRSITPPPSSFRQPSNLLSVKSILEAVEVAKETVTSTTNLHKINATENSPEQQREIQKENEVFEKPKATVKGIIPALENADNPTLNSSKSNTDQESECICLETRIEDPKQRENHLVSNSNQKNRVLDRNLDSDDEEETSISQGGALHLLNIISADDSDDEVEYRSPVLHKEEIRKDDSDGSEIELQLKTVKKSLTFEDQTVMSETNARPSSTSSDAIINQESSGQTVMKVEPSHSEQFPQSSAQSNQRINLDRGFIVPERKNLMETIVTNSNKSESEKVSPFVTQVPISKEAASVPEAPRPSFNFIMYGGISCISLLLLLIFYWFMFRGNSNNTHNPSAEL